MKKKYEVFAFCDLSERFDGVVVVVAVAGAMYIRLSVDRMNMMVRSSCVIFMLALQYV